ncbi:MAG: hypothetical protein DRJ38_05180 [Thermoprotei archaeon]|nr:MAG: hypothetical protein DRJ38_05180 [Thermoprotei archaeon]
MIIYKNWITGFGSGVLKDRGSPLWFWLGTCILALIVFMCTVTIVQSIRTCRPMTERAFRGMLVVVTPLLLFSIYCLRRGKGEVYSLKADTLPLVAVSLHIGLAGFIPPTIWSILLNLAFILTPVYLLHRRALRKMSAVNIPRSKRNRRVVELECPYDEAFNLCTLALNAVKGGAKILSRNKSTGLITTKTGATIYSWGEVITFNIRRVSDNRTRIEITSKPANIIQILDYGKNFENIEKIVAFLKEKCNLKQIN